MRRWVDQRGVVHAQQHVVVVRRGLDEPVPGVAQRLLDAVARSGTSVPGVRTPTQISAEGTCRRQSALRTTSAGEPVTAAGSQTGARGERRPGDNGGAAGPSASREGLGLRQDAGMATPADLGIRIGSLPSGPTTPWSTSRASGSGTRRSSTTTRRPPFGRGIARTGVTVLDLGGDTWASPVPAGVALLNGAGELTARSQIDEWGLLETPVFLTSTMQVGRVYDAACRLLMAEQPRIGVDDVIIPVVGECDDSWLNDPRCMHVTDEHVAAALAAARVSVGSGVAPGPGRGRCRHRDVVLQLQGRHRHRVARAARRPRASACCC